jgi:glucose/arabinose dehydrogenase
VRTIAAALAMLALVAGCSSSGGTAAVTPTTIASPSSSPSVLPSPSPSASPVTPTTTSVNRGLVKLTRVAGGLASPVYLTYAPDGSGRLFIVEQIGRIRVVKNGTLLPAPFLDIRSLVACCGERGLLSVAFHPQFATNGVFIVNYTRSYGHVGDTVIARYRVTTPGSDVANRSTGQVLLVVNQPQANHNGGLVKYGPDGMLYIGMGDGGSGGDSGSGHAPQGNGQSLSTLLGKILRIDVGATGGYTIPPSNPNLGTGARREIWAYGVRNPWRFSFDRATGNLYIADVGQGSWEEVDFQLAASKGGQNYGWPNFEGDHAYRGGAVARYVGPATEYSHGGGRCSITGGYVYRGTRIKAMAGFYLLADYCNGQVYTLAHVRGKWWLSSFMDTAFLVSSFGEDEAGELYLVNLSGAVYRFDPN